MVNKIFIKYIICLYDDIFCFQMFFLFYPLNKGKRNLPYRQRCYPGSDVGGQNYFFGLGDRRVDLKEGVRSTIQFYCCKAMYINFPRQWGNTPISQ